MKILFSLLIVYCCFSCSSGKMISSSNVSKIKLVTTILKDSLQVLFRNTGEKDVYLFSSYFKDRFILNEKLLRLNKDNEVLMSYAPLLNYMGTVVSDRIILGHESILKLNQSKYSFIKIKPNHSIDIDLPIEIVCNNLKKSVKIISDFDPKNIIQDSINYRDISNITVNSILFQFAIFDNVDLLITEGSEYRNKKDFISLAKSYSILTTKIGCSNY